MATIIRWFRLWHFFFLPTHYSHPILSNQFSSLSLLLLLHPVISSDLSQSGPSGISTPAVDARLIPLCFSVVWLSAKTESKIPKRGKSTHWTTQHTPNPLRFSLFFDCFRFVSSSWSLFIYPSIYIPLQRKRKKKKKDLFGIFFFSRTILLPPPSICIFFASCISTLAACFGNRL